MGRSQRTKGHNFERRIAKELRDEVGLDAERGLQSRGGSTEVPDVDCWPLWIECKAQIQPNIRAAYRQAVSGAPSHYIAAAVTKADRDTVLVTLSWADFKELLCEWRERGER